MSGTTDDIATLLQRIQETGENYRASDKQISAPERQALTNAAKDLLSALESPTAQAQRFALQPLAQASLCAAWKCGLVAAWPKDRMSAADLSEFTGAKGRLLVRLLRALITYGVFREVEQELYEHNELSLALSTPPLSQNLMPMAMRVLPGIAKLPEYLESISFRNPGDDPYDKTLFSYTNDTDLNFFQWLQQRPKQHAAFNASMAASVALERASSPHGFADLYPFERELGASVSSADEVVLVDVGGGYGHVLEDVKKHIPQLKGRMVLQDLPETIQSAKLADGVEAVAYDFFAEEQPVHGAHAYLLRHVLDDWSDVQVLQILANIVPAMQSGRSRLLLAEVVMPPTGASLYASLMDINMMRYSGMNRSEDQWRKLLGLAGLRMSKIWPPTHHDSIIEAVI